MSMSSFGYSQEAEQKNEMTEHKKEAMLTMLSGDSVYDLLIDLIDSIIEESMDVKIPRSSSTQINNFYRMLPAIRQEIQNINNRRQELILLANNLIEEINKCTFNLSRSKIDSINLKHQELVAKRADQIKTKQTGPLLAESLLKQLINIGIIQPNGGSLALSAEQVGDSHHYQHIELFFSSVVLLEQYEHQPSPGETLQRTYNKCETIIANFYAQLKNQGIDPTPPPVQIKPAYPLSSERGQEKKEQKNELILDKDDPHSKADFGTPSEKNKDLDPHQIAQVVKLDPKLEVKYIYAQALQKSLAKGTITGIAAKEVSIICDALADRLYQLKKYPSDAVAIKECFKITHTFIFQNKGIEKGRLNQVIAIGASSNFVEALANGYKDYYDPTSSRNTLDENKQAAKSNEKIMTLAIGIVESCFVDKDRAQKHTSGELPINITSAFSPEIAKAIMAYGQLLNQHAPRRQQIDFRNGSGYQIDDKLMPQEINKLKTHILAIANNNEHPLHGLITTSRYYLCKALGMQEKTVSGLGDRPPGAGARPAAYAPGWSDQDEMKKREEAELKLAMQRSMAETKQTSAAARQPAMGDMPSGLGKMLAALDSQQDEADELSALIKMKIEQSKAQQARAAAEATPAIASAPAVDDSEPGAAAPDFGELEPGAAIGHFLPITKGSVSAATAPQTSHMQPQRAVATIKVLQQPPSSQSTSYPQNGKEQQSAAATAGYAGAGTQTTAGIMGRLPAQAPQHGAGAVAHQQPAAPVQAQVWSVRSIPKVTSLYTQFRVEYDNAKKQASMPVPRQG